MNRDCGAVMGTNYIGFNHAVIFHIHILQQTATGASKLDKLYDLYTTKKNIEYSP